MVSLRLFRLITSNIYYEIIKNLAFKRPQIIHNLHINSKTISLFDYKIGGDDDKFDTLVISAVLFCFQNIIMDINKNRCLLYGLTFDASQEYVKNKTLANHIERVIGYRGDLPVKRDKMDDYLKSHYDEWKKSIKAIVAICSRQGVVDTAIEIVRTISQGIKIMLKSEDSYDKQQLKALEEQTKNRGFNFEDVIDGSFVTNDMIEIYDQLIKTADQYTQINSNVDQNTIDIICESKHVDCDAIIKSFALDKPLKY